MNIVEQVLNNTKKGLIFWDVVKDLTKLGITTSVYKNDNFDTLVELGVYKTYPFSKKFIVGVNKADGQIMVSVDLEQNQWKQVYSISDIVNIINKINVDELNFITKVLLKKT